MQLTVHEQIYVYVSIVDSGFVHAIITPRYYNIIINEIYRAPPGVYENSVYTMFSSPFTFTTLNEYLPFERSHIGGLKLRVNMAPKKTVALVKFHQACLQVYRDYNLSPDLLWFDYIKDSDSLYSAKFKGIYDQFLQSCISAN